MIKENNKNWNLSKIWSFLWSWDGEILFEQVIVIRKVLKIESKLRFMIFSYLKTFDCFLNVGTTYKITLTSVVTIIYTERSLSKLKLLKIYLKSITPSICKNELLKMMTL